MGIVAVIIIGFIVFGIIGAIIEFIGDHIGQIIGFILFLLVLSGVIHFAPAIMSACRTVLKTIAGTFQAVVSVIPIGLLAGILIGSISIITLLGIIIKGIKNSIRGSKGKKLIRWLNSVGVGKIDLSADNQETLDYLGKQGQITVFSKNYVALVNFVKAIRLENYYRRFISKRDMLDICVQVLSTFDTRCFDELFEFFQNQHLLLPFPIASEQANYVPIYFVVECEQAFETEGAATYDEMASLLEQAFPDNIPDGYYGILSQFVLDRLVEKGSVSTSPLDSGTLLYVSKHPQEGTKLVRREISLD